MSPTITDLGKKVKTKFPGQYDDLPDDEVGRRVKAKHPGAYDDFADTSKPSVPGMPMEQYGGAAPAPPKPPFPGELGGHDPSYPEVAKPSDSIVDKARRVMLGGQSPNLDYRKPVKLPVVSDAAQSMSDVPYGVAQMGAKIPAGSSRGNEVAKGASRVIGGLSTAASAMLPGAIAAAPLKTALGVVTGVMAKEGVSAIPVPPKYEGYRDLAGDALGIAAGYGTSKIPDAVTAMRKVDPRIATNRAVRPTPRDANFSKEIPQTLRAVLAANGEKVPGGFTDGTMDVIPATNRAIDQHQAALDQWLTRAKGVRVNGDELVSATRDAIPKIMWERDPQGARRLIQDAQSAFGGKTYTTDDFRDFLRSDNADLSKFYAQSQASQGNAATAGTPLESATCSIRR